MSTCGPASWVPASQKAARVSLCPVSFWSSDSSRRHPQSLTRGPGSLCRLPAGFGRDSPGGPRKLAPRVGSLDSGDATVNPEASCRQRLVAGLWLTAWTNRSRGGHGGNTASRGRPTSFPHLGKSSSPLTTSQTNTCSSLTEQTPLCVRTRRGLRARRSQYQTGGMPVICRLREAGIRVSVQRLG